MTASTSRRAATDRYRVPEVYVEPQPRAPAGPAGRTDVAGFIGFEPRVRDGTTTSCLTGGSPPTGHDFNVDVAGFRLVLGGRPVTVPPTRDFDLSSDPVSVPLTDGQSIGYALAAVERGGAARLVVASGVAASGPGTAPGDSALAAAVRDFFVSTGDPVEVARERPWLRVVNVVVRRTGGSVRLTIHPAQALVRCDDWNDFRSAFGEPTDDGTFLSPAVRAYFANGGSRCYIATVPRPDFADAVELDRARQDMIGVQGSGETEATGLERLLLVEEVSVIDVPDLYARLVEERSETATLGARAEEARFLPCPDILGPAGPVQAHGGFTASEPLFGEDQVFATQRDMLRRCILERWRVLLVLCPPLGKFDSRGPPTTESALRWRDRFDRLVKFEGFAETEEMACAALYFPWVLAQERVDAPIVELPPTPFAAGVIARRDLARGPHVAPANETLRGVVGLTVALDDDPHGRLYSPEPDARGLAVPAINVLRAFPGFGIQVWGARTMSTERWLRYLTVRRCLSAVERRVKAALDPVVFEPNTPLLWLQVTHLVLGVMLPVFDSGALRGERPEEAFYVRCDSTVNPPEEVQAGRLVCEVGVAVAAPAEFLVFRLGRREGVVEVIE